LALSETQGTTLSPRRHRGHGEERPKAAGRRSLLNPQSQIRNPQSNRPQAPVQTSHFKLDTSPAVNANNAWEIIEAEENRNYNDFIEES
jgi:hypothetical protein